MYRFDECRIQTDPSCPNYIKQILTPIEIYDALDDDSVKLASKETDKDLFEDKASSEQEDKD